MIYQKLPAIHTLGNEEDLRLMGNGCYGKCEYSDIGISCHEGKNPEED